MRKAWIIVVIFLVCFALIGCGKNDNIIDPPNYTYVIHKGEPISVQALDGEYKINTDTVYGYPITGNQDFGRDIRMSLYRVHSDGRKEPVNAVWVADPPELGFWERNDEIWVNEIFTTNSGIGKIKAYIAEDDTYAERDIVVYDVVAISSKPDEISLEPGVTHPNFIDFSPEIDEPDIVFDGYRIMADVCIPEYTRLEDIVYFPQEGYTTEFTYTSRSFVIRTKEGYHVKMRRGESLLHPTDGFASYYYYYIEKDSTTQFKY